MLDHLNDSKIHLQPVLVIFQKSFSITAALALLGFALDNLFEE